MASKCRPLRFKAESDLQQGHLNLPRATWNVKGLRGPQSTQVKKEWLLQSTTPFSANNIGKTTYSHAKE